MLGTGSQQCHLGRAQQSGQGHAVTGMPDCMLSRLTAELNFQPCLAVLCPSISCAPRQEETLCFSSSGTTEKPRPFCSPALGDKAVCILSITMLGGSGSRAMAVGLYFQHKPQLFGQFSLSPYRDDLKTYRLSLPPALEHITVIVLPLFLSRRWRLAFKQGYARLPNVF